MSSGSCYTVFLLTCLFFFTFASLSAERRDEFFQSSYCLRKTVTAVHTLVEERQLFMWKYNKNDTEVQCRQWLFKQVDFENLWIWYIWSHDVIPIIGCEIMLWQQIWANLCEKCEQEGTWDTPLLCTGVTAKWITTQASRRVGHIRRIYVSNQPFVLT